jgi:hypothetical protein
MEHAAFITKTESLQCIDGIYSRLYYGNEFCQHLIPSLDEIKQVSDFTRMRSLAFTLVTPFVTNEGLQALKPLLSYVVKHTASSEVVINDWGVLRMAKEQFPSLTLVLGRLLTKQKRGPRLLRLTRRMPPEMIEHFRASNIDVPIVVDFLRQKGIERVELDNLLQGISRGKDVLRASLYVPYVFVTTTRYCISAFCERQDHFSRDITACRKECSRYIFDLTHKNMPVPLMLKGNTQFFKNETLPDDFEALHIDRIVHEPEIPV